MTTRCLSVCARILTSTAPLAATIILVGGCATYTTPGGPAPIGKMTTESVADRLRCVPEAPIPATMAYARVQDSGWRSWTDDGVARGNLSLVGPRELEREVDAKAMAAWPDVKALVRLTPILVPTHTDSLLAMREGAASLQADVLALYTLDTDFHVDDHDFGPLGIISLGFAPTKNARVTCTVSIAFFDVRTGFCYGTAEATASDDQLASAWTSSDAVDQCRRRVERQAFVALIPQAGKAWGQAAANRRVALGQ